MSHVLVHVFQTCQGILRNLYFTWDQLTGPYLNAHSARAQRGHWETLKGEVGRDFSYGRFCWIWVVIGEWFCFQNRATVYNQVDSHWSISSKSHYYYNVITIHIRIAILVKCFGIMDLDQPLDIVWTYWMYCWFKTKRGPKWAQEVPSYPQVDKSAVAASKSSSLATKWRIDGWVCER